MTKMFSTIAKREHAVRCLLALSKELDAEVDVREKREFREVHVMMGRGGYTVSVAISGIAVYDCAITHWNVKHDSMGTFPASFPSWARVNEFHHRKATGIHHSLDDLLRDIREGFQKLQEA